MNQHKASTEDGTKKRWPVISPEEFMEITNRLRQALPGPWKFEAFPSGSMFITMKEAFPGGIQNPDTSSAQGFLGARMELLNVAAFEVGTGESDLELHEQRFLTGIFISHARTDMEKLIAQVGASSKRIAQLRIENQRLNMELEKLKGEQEPHAERS